MAHPEMAMAATISSALLVTATSKEAKAAIKASGGAWVSSLNGWIFPEAQRASVTEALKAAGVGVNDPGAASSAAAPAAVLPSVKANAGLAVKAHKRAILVTGDTLKVKPQLSGLKGKWNRALVGWIFPASRRQEVVDFLRQDPTNTVVDVGGGGGGGAPSSAAKADDDASDDGGDGHGQSGGAAAKTETAPAAKLDPNADAESSEEDAPLTSRLPAQPCAKKPAMKAAMKAATASSSSAPTAASGSRAKAVTASKPKQPPAKRQRRAATEADGGPDRRTRDEDFDEDDAEDDDNDNDDESDEYDEHDDEEGSMSEEEEDGAEDLAW